MTRHIEMPAVSAGLALTLKTLATTHNEAAVDVLVRGLNSTDAGIRDGCLAASMDRRSPAAHLEVLRRLDQLDEDSFDTLASKSGRISQALRQAVLDSDDTMCANGCKMALVVREFDLIPLLAKGVQDPEARHRDLLASTLKGLAELLYEELADPTEAMRNRKDRRDPQLMRQHITSPLEAAVADFARHRREEIVEAFLLIARPDNSTLYSVLSDPFHPAYLAVTNQLLHSPSHGVMGLLLNYLEDPSPPSSALASLGKRTDLDFIGHLLRRIEGRVSKTVAANLRRIDDVAWVHQPAQVIGALDEPLQRTAVEALMASRVRRLDVFRFVAHTLTKGKPEGRRAAAKALAEFNGNDANELALKALDDLDPEVQAEVISQIRARGIPGILPRLLQFAESPHDVVRTALREALDEFNFERFFASFDKLDDNVRETTAVLVGKIDNRAPELLARELSSPSPARRLRAITVADLMGVVNQLEGLIAGLLEDKDHSVRVEGARALAHATSNASVQALMEAMHDPSDLVREAAEQSLLEIKQLRDQAAELMHQEAASKAAQANTTFPAIPSTPATGDRS